MQPFFAPPPFMYAFKYYQLFHLFIIILQYTTLHCTVLHHISLHCTALQNKFIHFTVVHSTALDDTAPQCIAQHCTSPRHSPAQHYTTMHATAPHWTTLHCTSQTCKELHFFSLHYTALQALQTVTLHCTAKLCIAPTVFAGLLFMHFIFTFILHFLRSNTLTIWWTASITSRPSHCITKPRLLLSTSKTLSPEARKHSRVITISVEFYSIHPIF